VLWKTSKERASKVFTKGAKEMKLLIENWKNYLNEVKMSFNDVALLQFKDTSGYGFILYRVYFHPTIKTNVISVIGRVTVGETIEPCIPKTNQVDTIYVDKPYRGMGFGSMLYNIAFLFADYRKMGLTSDKTTGTNKKAAAQWDKFDSRSNYKRKITSQGNDRFDYTGRMTPLDPDDDCSMPAVPEKNATDHSLIKTNARDFAPKFMEMYKLHPVYIEKVIKSGFFKNQNAFEDYLKSQAEDDFQENYLDEPE
jgi:GNAT superfamily N-acetyltransferase